MLSRWLGFAALFTSAGLTRVAAQPAEFVWENGLSGNWSSAAAWRGGVAPSPTAPVHLRFRPRSAGILATSNDLGSFDDVRLSFELSRGTLGVLGTNGNARTVSSSLALRFRAGGFIHQDGAGDAAIIAPMTLDSELEVGGGGLGNLRLGGPLSGAGSLRVSTGPHTLFLWPESGTSTFSGGVDLISGQILIGNGSPLGTGSLRVVNGTLGVMPFPSPITLTVPNAIDIAQSLTLSGYGGLNLSGPLSGAGALNIAGQAYQGAYLGIRGVQIATAGAFTGSVDIRGDALTVSLNGTSGFSAVSGVRVSGGATLELDDRSAATTVDRLADNVIVQLSSGALALRSGTGRTSQENIGTLRTSGLSRVQLNVGSVDAGNSAVLSVANWEPAPGSLTYFAGRNLGGAAPGTAGSDAVVFGNAAALAASLVGGGGAPGTRTVSILPQAVGASGLLNPFQFATLGPNGVRALFGSELSGTLVDGSNELANVRLLDAVTVNTATRVNALALDSLSSPSPRNGSVSGSGTLTIESGLLLLGPSASNSLSVANLDFAGRRAVITTVSGTFGPQISSRLTAAGLTVAGTGPLTLSGNNQIDGSIVVAAPLSASAAALGGSGAIEIQGGSLSVTGSVTRDVVATPAGGIFGSGNLLGTLRGAGEIRLGGTLSGTAAFDGPTRIRFGGLTLANSAALDSHVTLQALLGTFSSELRIDAPTTLANPLFVGTQDIANSLTVTTNASLTVPGLRTTGVSTILPSGLLKSGSGTLTVAGDLDLRGPIAVQAGALYVNGAVAAPGLNSAGAFTVSANAVFGGEARVYRDVTVSGILQPGFNSTGRLQIAGTLTLNAGAGYVWERTATAADLLQAETVTFSGGTLQLRLRALDAALPSGFDLLLRADSSMTGTLPTFVLDFTDAPAWAGLGLSVQQIGNDLYLVPEPSVLAWLGCALAGLAGAVRVRRRR
ncbi:MAG: hypothetical protein JSR82_07895 [Verrucomicrobia bacterium]|nr:hypothetical protein [Verrucomicrobiota bacterium]